MLNWLSEDFQKKGVIIIIFHPWQETVRGRRAHKNAHVSISNCVKIGRVTMATTPYQNALHSGLCVYGSCVLSPARVYIFK